MISVILLILFHQRIPASLREPLQCAERDGSSITKSSKLPTLGSRWRSCTAAILIPPQGSSSVTHPIEKGHSGLIAARPGVELLQG